LQGPFDEALYRRLLRSKGYHIFEKGYRTKFEEIDILATQRAEARNRFSVFMVAPWRLPSHIENVWRHNA